MNLFVTIIPPDHERGHYPTYITQEGGVSVGAAGQLVLVAAAKNGVGTEFRIYAPGTWKEVNVSPVED